MTTLCRDWETINNPFGGHRYHSRPKLFSRTKKFHDQLIICGGCYLSVTSPQLLLEGWESNRLRRRSQKTNGCSCFRARSVINYRYRSQGETLLGIVTGWLPTGPGCPLLNFNIWNRFHWVDTLYIKLGSLYLHGSKHFTDTIEHTAQKTQYRIRRRRGKC